MLAMTSGALRSLGLGGFPRYLHTAETAVSHFRAWHHWRCKFESEIDEHGFHETGSIRDMLPDQFVASIELGAHTK